MIKRIISDEQRTKIKRLKKYKGKAVSQLSKNEKDELLQLVAEKLNLI